MSNNKQQGGLSEKFQGFGAAPSDALWGSIAAAIDEKKSRKGAFWWWLGSGLAASFVLVYVSMNMWSAPENAAAVDGSEIAPADYRVLDPHQVPNAHFVELIEELLEEPFIQMEFDAQSKLENGNEKSEQQIRPALSVENQKNDKKQVFDPNEKKIELKIKEDESAIKSLLKPTIDLLNVKLQNPLITNLEVLKKERHNPWEMGFNIAYYRVNNLSAFSKKQEVYVAQPVVGSQQVNSNAFINGTQENGALLSTQDLLPSPYAVIIPSTQSSAKKNINFEFYAGKYLSKRWMFNTGLGFSRSTYKTIYNNGFLLSQITNISSLIVPIGLSIDAVKLPKFKLRPGLTLNNEFAVYENYKAEALEPYSSPNKFVKGYSASLELTVGHLFRIKPRIAINVAPSFRYYFSQNIQSQNYLIKENSWIGGKIGMIWTL